MNDLISRQAAISAICNACGKIDCDKMDKCEKLQLPPANCSEFPNNSDTISRQAAIDALGGNEPVGDPSKMDDDDVVKMWERIRIINIINKLPSAQPEPPEECERCMMEHTDEMEKLEAELAMAQPKRGRWIIAKEQRRKDVENGNYMYNCSNCGCGDLHSKAIKVSYCWNCGADMREVRE